MDGLMRGEATASAARQLSIKGLGLLWWGSAALASARAILTAPWLNALLRPCCELDSQRRSNKFCVHHRKRLRAQRQKQFILHMVHAP